VCLSGARRALYREHTAFNGARDAECCLQARLFILLDLLTADAGSPAQENVASGLKGAVTLHTAIGNRFAKADQCIRKDFGIDDVMGVDRLRMKVCAIDPLFDIDPTLFDRNRLDSAERCAAEITQFFIAPHFSFLRRKVVTMDRCFCCAAVRPDKCQSGETSALIEQIFGAEIGEPKMFPPKRLLFTPMPVEAVR
jgi:hypothetical protein